MNSQLKEKLQKLAFERTTPFCYGCYKDAPTGKCVSCGSDDLMRHLPGVGVEYGTDWVIEEILETELEKVDLEQDFEESIRGCYPEETQIGWMTLNTVTVLKEMDPISWQCALSEYESREEEEGNTCSINGSEYYRVSDIENLIV